MIVCNVCNTVLTKVLYESPGEMSLTSLNTVVKYPTQVFFCHNCGHVQTPEMSDESAYYDESYNILTNSEDEDQIYIVENDKVVYRTQHQVSIMLKKLEITSDKKLLDYGCAKSSTMHELVRRDEKLQPYLFDISEKYIPFWKEFIKDGQWATYTIPDNWSLTFDIVTSFFSLEHITKLDDALQNIKRLLVSGGVLYAIIPNTQANPADLIVVDHPNHFTVPSLNRLLLRNGFTVREIDDVSHRGAYIVIAEKKQPVAQPREKLDELDKTVTQLGEFWTSAAKRVRDFEKNQPEDMRSAIYGAGFYGSFLASNLKSLSKISCFLDQNKFLQGASLMGRPVVAPTHLPSDVNVIYVALNPQHSKKIINDIDFFKNKNINFFYI